MLYDAVLLQLDRWEKNVILILFLFQNVESSRDEKSCVNQVSGEIKFPNGNKYSASDPS